MKEIFRITAILQINKNEENWNKITSGFDDLNRKSKPKWKILNSLLNWDSRDIARGSIDIWFCHPQAEIYNHKWFLGFYKLELWNISQFSFRHQARWSLLHYSLVHSNDLWNVLGIGLDFHMKLWHSKNIFKLKSCLKFSYNFWHISNMILLISVQFQTKPLSTQCYFIWVMLKIHPRWEINQKIWPFWLNLKQDALVWKYVLTCKYEYLPELPCFVASITCVPSKRNKYDDPIPFLVYSTSRLSATINRVDWPTYSITKSSWGMSSSALHTIQNYAQTAI